MPEITESRLVKVAGRIVTTGDLYRLANLVDKESKTIVDEKISIETSYIATCDDGSVFSSQDPSLFSDESPISSKRVTSAHIGFIAYGQGQSIDIDLRHTAAKAAMATRFPLRVQIPHGSMECWLHFRKLLTDLLRKTKSFANIAG